MTITPTPVIFGEKSSKPALHWVSSEWRGILAEFVATALLLTFGCMACIPMDDIPASDSIFGPLGFGFTVMFNIQIFGHISGAFMNPFVTIAAVIWGKISIATGVAYILAECAGATLGYGLLTTLAHIDIAAEAVCVTLPRSGINEFQALGVEMVLSAALSLINCGVWDPVNAHNSDSVPLKFAFTIVGLSYAGAHLTGASMNPARSLGPAIWANRWDIHWVYWVGPLVGGVLPAIFYKYVWLRKPDPKLQD
ncbi:aquaporin-like [Ostrinia nubilalis]|uniref:aquaporin-like n=1 Tax=Ostrinia nubilalis TaxID=29057 RepID=UPI00308241A4